MTDECRHKLQILKDTCHAYCEICGEWEAEIQQKRIAALEVERDDLKDTTKVMADVAFARDRRIDALETALDDLVSKLDACEPFISSAFTNTYPLRGGKYTGPQYGEELKRARSLLPAKQPTNGGGG